VLYDHPTKSIWMHLTGECIAGPHLGRRLVPLDTGRHTRWGEWRRTWPETEVMAPDPERRHEYVPAPASSAGHPYFDGPFPRTLHDRDGRLPPNALVHGIVVSGKPRAYPHSSLEKAGGVVEESFQGLDLTIWYDAGSRSAAAHLRRAADRTLSFEPASPGLFRDRETGSLWNLEGVCVEGPLQGSALPRAFGLQSEWYGWFANHPKTGLFVP
jgi:hypothetical protein